MINKTSPESLNISHELILRILFPIFFMSGFAALLYQVAWQRILVLFSGADIYSVTVIVTSFMGGLGFGSLAGGYLADRLSRRQNLVLFAIAEIFIALFAIVSKRLFYDFLYIKFHYLAQSPLELTSVLFASLLLPTFFMGLSLPVLSKALAYRISSTASIVGSLYGFNTLGAAIGSIVSAFIFMRSFGIEKSLFIGSIINFVCAGAGLLLACHFMKETKELGQEVIVSNEGESSDTRSSPNFFPFSVWSFIFGLSGFIALSLEIVWFRLLGVMLKSNAFTFSFLLFVYLSGLAIGVLTAVKCINKIKNPIQLFFICQSLITIYSSLTLTLFVNGLGKFDFLNHLWTYFHQYEPMGGYVGRSVITDILIRHIPISQGTKEHLLIMILLYLVLPIILIAIPTFLMGFSFPFFQKYIQQDIASVGRRVGCLQASNIVGSMLGAVLVGWVFFSFFDISLTLKILVALGGLFLFLGSIKVFSFKLPFRIAFSVSAVFLIFISVRIIPDAKVIWAKLHGTDSEKIILGEDSTGLSLLRNSRSDFADETTVFVNGKGQSWIPYGRVHTVLGFLPSILHPNPKEIAVIGLGSGDTVFSAGGREETEQITCIEIIAPQLHTLKLLAQRDKYPALINLFQDSRMRFITGDGRAYIMRGNKKYDIIEADALRPGDAYAGNIFSYEYFKLLRAHLNKGGFAVTWAPRKRVIDTFIKVFPHVLYFSPVLIGSNDPIEFNKEKIEGRLNSKWTQQYYRRAGIDIIALGSEVLSNQPVNYSDASFDKSNILDINTDLFPKDEFSVR